MPTWIVADDLNTQGLSRLYVIHTAKPFFVQAFNVEKNKDGCLVRQGVWDCFNRPNIDFLSFSHAFRDYKREAGNALKQFLKETPLDLSAKKPNKCPRDKWLLGYDDEARPAYIIHLEHPRCILTEEMTQPDGQLAFQIHSWADNPPSTEHERAQFIRNGIQALVTFRNATPEKPSLPHDNRIEPTDADLDATADG